QHRGRDPRCPLHLVCAYATARARSSAAESGLDSPPSLDYERPGVMSSPIFIGSAFVAQYPTGGGGFWVPLQYLLGLRELGHDAWWLEMLWTRGDAARDRESIDGFWRQAEAFGVADRIVLLHLPDSTREGAQGRVEYLGLDEAAFAARRRDALLINVAHTVTAPYPAGLPPPAPLALDPGNLPLSGREC